VSDTGLAARPTAVPRILVVEDEEEISNSLVEALLDRGFYVAAAYDGEKALAALAEARFEAMVLDLIMPRIGGLAVIEEVRRRRLELPIVLISEHIGALDRHRFGEFGISHVLRKPVDPAALAELVAQVIAAGSAPARPTPCA